jgi:pimeloyl-ACP methyl ester carboxylesterase
MKRLVATLTLLATIPMAACSSSSDRTTRSPGGTTMSTDDTTRPADCAPPTLPPGTAIGDAVVHWTDACVPFVRTPEARFADLPDFPYAAHFQEVDGLRMAYVDEGPRDGQVVLLLHGEPSWSYLYRKMIPILTHAGYRVIAPDMIGMGRSDKPIQFTDYTYLHHVRWVGEFITALDLHDVTAFVQDWGSLIGLRVIGDHPDRFARVVVGNGRLPVLPAGIKPVTIPEPLVSNDEWTLPFHADAPEIPVTPSPFVPSRFVQWVVFALAGSQLRASDVIDALTTTHLSPAELAAYDAPFPDRIHMTGPRVFPSLINTISETPTNQGAREVFNAWTKPLLTLFGRRDPNLGTDAIQAEMRDTVPGAVGQPHHAYPDAGHFVQEDVGPDLAHRIDAFIRANPLPQS